jgi:hypothetical protein
VGQPNSSRRRRWSGVPAFYAPIKHLHQSPSEPLFNVWQYSRFHALKLLRSSLFTLLQCQLHQEASFVRTNRRHDGIDLLHARHMVSVMMLNTVLAAQRMPPCILLCFKQFYQDATPEQMQQGCQNQLMCSEHSERCG